MGCWIFNDDKWQRTILKRVTREHFESENYVPFMETFLGDHDPLIWNFGKAMLKMWTGLPFGRIFIFKIVYKLFNDEKCHLPTKLWKNTRLKILEFYQMAVLRHSSTVFAPVSEKPAPEPVPLIFFNPSSLTNFPLWIISPLFFLNYNV